VLHGDIREDNILITDCEVYFIDFDLSSILPSSEQCEAEIKELIEIFRTFDVDNLKRCALSSRLPWKEIS